MVASSPASAYPRRPMPESKYSWALSCCSGWHTLIGSRAGQTFCPSAAGLPLFVVIACPCCGPTLSRPFSRTVLIGMTSIHTIERDLGQGFTGTFWTFSRLLSSKKARHGPRSAVAPLTCAANPLPSGISVLEAKSFDEFSFRVAVCGLAGFGNSPAAHRQDPAVASPAGRMALAPRSQSRRFCLAHALTACVGPRHDLCQVGGATARQRFGCDHAPQAALRCAGRMGPRSLPKWSRVRGSGHHRRPLYGLPVLRPQGGPSMP